MTNPAAVSPLDVFGHLASMAAAHGGVWEEIHDAVAELLATDRELDAIRAEFAAADKAGGESTEMLWKLTKEERAAWKRRAAAIAAFGEVG